MTLAGGSANNLTGTTAVPLDPGLTPLQGNAGPTLAFAPLPGSPVVDAGSNPANLTADQTGGPRALGAVPDIGAVEQLPATPVAAREVVPDVTTAGGTIYQFTVAYYDSAAISTATATNLNAVRVTGPNGFNAAPIAAVPDMPSDGSPRTVTYTIVPPGGSWDEPTTVPTPSPSRQTK